MIFTFLFSSRLSYLEYCNHIYKAKNTICMIDSHMRRSQPSDEKQTTKKKEKKKRQIITQWPSQRPEAAENLSAPA